MSSGSFVVRYVEMLRSASRKILEREDILHALAHAVVVEQIGDDPSR